MSSTCLQERDRCCVASGKHHTDGDAVQVSTKININCCRCKHGQCDVCWFFTSCYGGWYEAGTESWNLCSAWSKRIFLKKSIITQLTWRRTRKPICDVTCHPRHQAGTSCKRTINDFVTLWSYRRRHSYFLNHICSYAHTLILCNELSAVA